jgi:hypothetical protein
MARRAATLAAFNDPDGTRYGLPTFPWNGTWNLRPEPAAQLMWRSRRARRTGGIRVALLYRVDLALPNASRQFRSCALSSPAHRADDLPRRTGRVRADV